MILSDLSEIIKFSGLVQFRVTLLALEIVLLIVLVIGFSTV